MAGRNFFRTGLFTLTVLWLVLGLAGCGNDRELPLTLPVGAEPSAKLRNDRGISHYQAGRYLDALLQFTQAAAADRTAGEIHFNIALAFHKRGNSKKALEHFELAKKFAYGNVQILSSELLSQYLKPEK